MKRIIYLLPIFIFIVGLVIIGCGVNDDDNGACVWPGTSCIDNKTSGQCHLIDGSFYKGKTCAQLGYR